jgi:chromosome segregation ATPase
MSLKDLFFKEDEEPVQKNVEEKTETRPSQTTVSNVMSSSEQVVKFKNQILDTLNKQPANGFDYSKFKQSLNKIQSGTEQSKYEMVYGVAETMGTTKSLLIETAKRSAQVVRDELAKLDASKNSLYNEKVTSVEKNIESVKQQIQQKQEQIAKLNQEVSQLQTEKQTAEVQVVEAKNKIEQKVQSYTQAAAELVQEIEKDITNLTNYLK